MDTVLLSRIQFAFTAGYHFLFVPLSLGLAVTLVWAERRYYHSRLAEDQAASRFWVRLFTATFAIGVATGITMEFAFGTNWAAYSRFVGDIFGAPLAAEALLSFFLESTFLGVLLFGRDRVSPRFYYVSAWLVALGAHLSALWIIIANSWQQTPAGYAIQDGRAVLTDFFAAAFNPSTVPRYLHTVTATWVAGAFLVAGVSSWYLLQGRHVSFARRALGTSLVLGLLTSMAMPLVGHFHALQVVDTQPAKMAAFEGVFETQSGAGLTLLGWVDETDQKVVALKMPNLLSILVGGSPRTVIQGLNDVPPQDRPPLQLTFQLFHLMVALGLYFILLMAVGLALRYRGRLETSRRYLKTLVYSSPLPVLASQLGWAAAEVGRQPWIVQGELRTRDAVSATVPASQVGLSLAIFAVIYALLFVGWLRVVLGLIRKGPDETTLVPVPASREVSAPSVAG